MVWYSDLGAESGVIHVGIMFSKFSNSYDLHMQDVPMNYYF